MRNVKLFAIDILHTKIGECICENTTIGGFGNCEADYSNYGRSGRICYVPEINTCSISFKGNNGWYSYDPCSSLTKEGLILNDYNTLNSINLLYPAKILFCNDHFT